ncbi:MAG: hypothetical protein ABI740_08440 [Alphaproteobacteria bacterium]
MDKVDSACVVEVLPPIWLDIADTARRILQRIGAVLDFAHIKGWRPEKTSLRSVRKGLPRQLDKGGHLEAMPYADVPALMAKLAAASSNKGRGRAALHDLQSGTLQRDALCRLDRVRPE